MKNLFKIKFAVSLLLTILLTLSLSLPALAAVKSNANVGTVSFLLQGITGDLNLKKVRMVAYVPIKGKTNTFYNTEVATEATMTNTADGYLVTVPNVDWSLTFSYQVLVVTDRYIWPTFATQNIASQGPIKLNTNRFVSVPPSVSVSGKPNFQMDKMAMWLGGDFTDYAFLQEVTPGQSVPNNGYIYRTLVFGHDDDHEYVITANYYSYAPGPLVINTPLSEVKVDHDNPDFKLTGIGVDSTFDDNNNLPGMMQPFASNQTVNGIYVSYFSFNVPVTYNFSNSKGVVYSYTSKDSPSWQGGPYTYHFDSNLHMSMTVDRAFYHPNDQLILPQALGLQVVDSHGNTLVGAYDSEGKTLGQLVFARNDEVIPYSINWHGYPQPITLPNETGDFSLTFKLAPVASSEAQMVKPIKLVPDPVAPTVQPYSDSDTMIKGTAEPGWRVSVMYDGAMTTVQNDGTFVLYPFYYHAPNSIIYLQFTDADRNVQDIVPLLVGMRQSQVNDVLDTARTVTGKAQPNATITVSTTDKLLGRSTAHKDGSFSVPIKPQLGGTLLFINAYSGNAGVNNRVTTTVVIDTTAPIPPKVSTISDVGTELGGWAEPYSTITVHKDDQMIGTGTTDAYGFFELTLTTTSPKGTVLTVTATDTSGNTSNPAILKVVSSVDPVVPTVDPVFDTSTKVTGHADPFNTIAVFAGKSKLGTVQTGADGTFSLSIRKQAIGTALTVTATDVISRMSTAKLTVQDGTPPAIPTVNTVTSTSTKVTGTAEKDATITITVGDKIYTGTVDRYGRFVITIDKQAKGTVLSVTATDKSNNTSKPKLVTVR